MTLTEQLSGAMQKLAYWVLGSAFSRVRHKSLPACTRVPHREGNWVGFLYLMSGSETDEGVAKDKVFAGTGNSTRDSGFKDQYAIH